jgi:hypothetical protein
MVRAVQAYLVAEPAVRRLLVQAFLARIEVDSDDERAELASPWGEMQRAATYMRRMSARPPARTLRRRAPVMEGRSTKDHDLVFAGHGSNKNPLVGRQGLEP